MTKQDMLEAVGFQLAIEIAKIAPRKTSRMANSFPATARVQNGVIKYTTPDYTKYIEFGTLHIRPRFFIRDTLHRKLPEIIKRNIHLLNKK